jgi:hypothetical protein
MHQMRGALPLCSVFRMLCGTTAQKYATFGAGTATCGTVTLMESGGGVNVGANVDGIDLMVTAGENARVRLFRHAYETLGLYDGGIRIWAPYGEHSRSRVCDRWGP